MTPQDCLIVAVRPALALLPDKMTSREALAEMLAIGLQESGLRTRRQVNGPARGLWQFEGIGAATEEVMINRLTAPFAIEVTRRLDYQYESSAVHKALGENDVLAAVFARLLLFLEPAALPKEGYALEGWRQYINNWRPAEKGRTEEDRARWARNYELAWKAV